MNLENKIITLSRRLRGHNLTLTESEAILKAIKELKDTVKVATRGQEAE